MFQKRPLLRSRPLTHCPRARRVALVEPAQPGSSGMISAIAGAMARSGPPPCQIHRVRIDDTHTVYGRCFLRRLRVSAWVINRYKRRFEAPLPARHRVYLYAVAYRKGWPCEAHAPSRSMSVSVPRMARRQFGTRRRIVHTPPCKAHLPLDCHCNSGITSQY
jgi:hypothetical protein